MIDSVSVSGSEWPPGGATQNQRPLPTTVELVIIGCMHLITTHPHFCKRDLVPSTYTNAVDHTVL
jgi:hypothetical protein